MHTLHYSDYTLHDSNHINNQQVDTIDRHGHMVVEERMQSLSKISVNVTNDLCTA